MEKLLSSQKDESKAAIIYLANRLLVSRDSSNPIQENFKSTLQSTYGASIEDVNFSSEGQKIQENVNGWVRNVTHGMIDSLLDSTPSSDTKAILLNAIYFKGKWLHEFNPNRTKPGTFYNKGSKDHGVQTDFMSLRDTKFRIGFNISVGSMETAVIELPYIDEKIMSYLILPRDLNGLTQMESKLTLEELNAAFGSLETEPVNLLLPKFKLSSEYSLVPVLTQMGITDVFSGNADLSGIKGTSDIFVSEVKHKAVVEVNEEGTKAAAATMAVITFKSIQFSADFLVDHPFLLVIKDLSTGLILFMARVDTL